MNAVLLRMNLVCASALLLAVAGSAAAADESAVRAVLHPAKERKAAPDFALTDFWQNGEAQGLPRQSGTA